MAVRKPAAQQQAALRQQQLALQQQQQLASGATLGQPITSPYDGTTATAPVFGGYPLEAGVRPGSLAGLDGGRPQVNATNQTALAPGGTVNQTVTNENKYENKYYNIITAPRGGFLGGIGGGFLGGLGIGQQPGSNCWVDPQTGVMYCRNEGGFTGWLKRLFRGY